MNIQPPGRKSRSVRVDGYKRHVLHDLDTDLIRAVGITLANVAEASVTKEIDADLALQGVRLTELHLQSSASCLMWVVPDKGDAAITMEISHSQMFVLIWLWEKSPYLSLYLFRQFVPEHFPPYQGTHTPAC